MPTEARATIQLDRLAFDHYVFFFLFFFLSLRRLGQCIQFEGELRHDTGHEHHTQHDGSHRVLVRSGVPGSDHGGAPGVLVHAVDDEGDRDGQQDDAVHLGERIIVLRERQDGDGGPRQRDAQVHPGQEGAFVGEEHLGFDLDGSLALLHQRADVVLALRRGGGRGFTTEELVPPGLFLLSTRLGLTGLLFGGT